MAREVVAVAGEAIAEGTQGDAVLIVAALKAGQGKVVAVGMTEANDAQGMPVGVDGPQDIVKAFSGIAQILTDGEVGEALVQVFEPGQGQQVVVAVGGSQAAGDGPESKETVVEDVEGFGLVAEVMLASGSGALFGIRVGTWVRSRLVGGGVIDVGGQWIAAGGKTAVVVSGGRIALAAFFACLACRTGTSCGRL
jgi:hypothetical protein